MTIDPTVAAQRSAIITFFCDHGHKEGEKCTLAERVDKLIAAVRTAHLQELAGETEEETRKKAIDAIFPNIECGCWSSPDPTDYPCARCVRSSEAIATELAPILTAPLRAKLQVQEARIKELELEALLNLSEEAP